MERPTALAVKVNPHFLPPGAPAVQKVTPREIREGHFSPERIADRQRRGLIDYTGER
jgi:hypothetical protein